MPALAECPGRLLLTCSVPQGSLLLHPGIVCHSHGLPAIRALQWVSEKLTGTIGCGMRTSTHIHPRALSSLALNRLADFCPSCEDFSGFSVSFSPGMPSFPVLGNKTHQVFSLEPEPPNTCCLPYQHCPGLHAPMQGTQWENIYNAG